MMRQYSKIATFLLVFIFLFSGLIKLNDPIGTQLKLEEYFDVFSQDFPAMEGFWKFWIPYALPLSILLSSLEVVLGIALWTNYRTQQVLWTFLGLLTFFGFLTFYSAYFNKVTDCGCFGETIKLTPWTSFFKDVFLFLLALSLLFTDKIKEFNTRMLPVGISALLSILLGVYTYFYLPIHDGLPYAVGENIPQNMKSREALRFSYVYKIQGKEVTLTEMPTDSQAVFVSMQALNEKEARPLITDYRIWVDNDTTDYTAESFKGKKLLVIIPNVHHSHLEALKDISQLAHEANKKGIIVWLLSASSDDEVNAIRHEYQLNFPALSADSKVLKTMIRSSPGLWVLNQGTVRGKWSAYHLPSIDEIDQSLLTLD
ncbi:BT_3928 family protein [Aquirufa rosea]|uniref:DoxX family protein n=1 Tax=Aquirufa rosea TaxID=2509241 RepID=A0A4V1M579_9BACT|nr:BT_3928 family protein [Aquirufa rosea]RXK47112.1 DoxX family protein [Aquirufa rosea]